MKTWHGINQIDTNVENCEGSSQATFIGNLLVCLDVNENGEADTDDFNEVNNWKLGKEISKVELPSFLSAENVKSAKIAEAIMLLKGMEIDGEAMQYILEKVGMDEQMLRQLIMKYQISAVLGLVAEKAEFIEQEIRRIALV